MKTRSGWLLAAFAGALLLAWGLLATSASAQTDGTSEEHIRSFDVTLNVSVNGDLEVREVITYDFGTEERRGILRDIPVRFHYDGTHDRVYDLTVLSVSSALAGGVVTSGL